MSLLFFRRLKLHLLPSPSPPFYYLSTPYLTSVSRLLSSTGSASPQAPPPNPHQLFSAEYLIHSCGLPSDVAVQVYNKIQHLKSPDKPDAVLRFLREIGMSESDITTAISRAPRLLCCTVEKILRPDVAKLQEVGLSMEDISVIISRSPRTFTFNFVPKVDFMLGVLGSAKNLSVALKKNVPLFHCKLEKVIVPNLSFLKEQCGLSAPQIAQLIKLDPRLISSKPETLKVKVQRVHELGISRSSGSFLYALIVVNRHKQCTINARINQLKSLGFSQEEVATIFSKLPPVLCITEETMARKIEFLRREVGCDNLYLVRNPSLLGYSLEKRLIPRNLVQKVLKLKELPVAHKTFTSFAMRTEKQFVERFVLPYEHDIPGLHRAYADVCAGKIGGIQWFKVYIKVTVLEVQEEMVL